MAVTCAMGGPLWFQDEFALPALKDAVTQLGEAGVPEYDDDSAFTFPDDVFERVPPIAFITGVEPLIAVYLMVGTSFGGWALGRIFDASWKSTKEAFSELLKRRSNEADALDRPIVLRHGYWLEQDGVRVEVRAEVAAGARGEAVPQLMEQALEKLAQLSVKPGETREEVVNVDG
jgi:hypothetical protein